MFRNSSVQRVYQPTGNLADGCTDKTRYCKHHEFHVTGELNIDRTLIKVPSCAGCGLARQDPRGSMGISPLLPSLTSTVTTRVLGFSLCGRGLEDSRVRTNLTGWPP